MPIISTFFGIVIRMWHDDHPPPHLHVEYQGQEAMIAIETGNIIKGQLPTRVAKIVYGWCERHRFELERNWHLAQSLEPLEKIIGADYD